MRHRKVVGLVVVGLAILAGRAVTLAQRPWPNRTNTMTLTPPPRKLSSPEPGPAAENNSAGDDPMAAVDAFLDRNRKEADESIKALTTEAEALKARLQKVEAALGRWQAVANALNQGTPAVEAVPPPEQPIQVEPVITPNSPDEVRPPVPSEPTLPPTPPPATGEVPLPPPAPTSPTDPASN